VAPLRTKIGFAIIIVAALLAIAASGGPTAPTHPSRPTPTPVHSR
jgi:hypothetical protein